MDFWTMGWLLLRVEAFRWALFRVQRALRALPRPDIAALRLCLPHCIAPLLRLLRLHPPREPLHFKLLNA